MLISLIMFPHTFITVMGYLFFITIVGALAGYILSNQTLIFISNSVGLIFTIAIGIGLLVNNWRWMDAAQIIPPITTENITENNVDNNTGEV